MRFFFLLPLGLLLCISRPLSAQILNIEKNLPELDTATHYWAGAAELAFSLNNRSGTPEAPSRFLSLKTNADLAYVSGLHRYMLINALQYRSLSGDPFIRTGHSHLRGSMNWRKPLGYEFFGQLQYDIGRGLKSRSLLGAGLRIRLFQREDALLTFGPGFMYERERWQIPGSEPLAYVEKKLLKSTNYLNLRWLFSPTLTFKLITYYQTGYDQAISAFRHRLSADTRLEFSITRRTRFVANFAATYENRPVVPIQKWIYQLDNGLLFTF